MNCPNDRYVNDEEICKAVAAMLAKTGVKSEPDRRDQGQLLPEDPVAQYVVLSARLDTRQLRLAQPAVRGDVHARRRRPGAVQSWQLQQRQGR